MYLFIYRVYLFMGLHFQPSQHCRYMILISCDQMFVVCTWKWSIKMERLVLVISFDAEVCIVIGKWTHRVPTQTPAC